MSFTFDPKTHTGMMDGVVWPSVTQLLNEFKLIDYSGVPEGTLEKKRILGTRVHFATGLIDDCNLDEDHMAKNFPECLPYLEAYRKFRVIEPFDPSEKTGRLVSKKWRFHGEPDEHGIHIGSFKGRTVLIDYKCTFVMFASTGPQLSGYKLLLAECLKIKIQDRYGLLLKPTGHYDLVPFKDDAGDLADFHACLRLHWSKRLKYKTTPTKGEVDERADNR